MKEVFDVHDRYANINMQEQNIHQEEQVFETASIYAIEDKKIQRLEHIKELQSKTNETINNKAIQ